MSLFRHQYVCGGVGGLLCQKPAGNLGSLHSFSAESNPSFGLNSDKSQIKVSMFTLLSGYNDFTLLHALITKKGIFPKNCDALWSCSWHSCDRRDLFFLLPGRDPLVSARWCVFKGCPVPLKHCIMAVLFCLLSLTDDTSALQWTI